MELPEQNSTKKFTVGRILRYGCGGIIALFVVIFLISVMLPERMKKRMEAEHMEENRREDMQDSLDRLGEIPTADTSTTETNSAETNTTEEKGLGVSRRTLTDLFEGDPFYFKFEKGKPVRGEENYVGTSTTINRNMIQLIGPAEDLTNASITAVIGSGVDNTSELTMVLGFAKQFNSDAVDWIGEQWKGTTWKDDFEHTTTIGRHRFELSYTRFDNIGSLSITITPP